MGSAGRKVADKLAKDLDEFGKDYRRE